MGTWKILVKLMKFDYQLWLNAFTNLIVDWILAKVALIFLKIQSVIQLTHLKWLSLFPHLLAWTLMSDLTLWFWNKFCHKFPKYFVVYIFKVTITFWHFSLHYPLTLLIKDLFSLFLIPHKFFFTENIKLPEH